MEKSMEPENRAAAGQGEGALLNVGVLGAEASGFGDTGKWETIERFHLPEYEQIPDIGLFLEQTVKYIDQLVSPLDGISITGSMISNYVKKKLVKNPVKKQYGREQIAALIIIVIVKNVLPIEDIHSLLGLVNASSSLPEAYEYFCVELTEVLRQVFNVKGGRAASDGDGTSREENAAVWKGLLHNVIITAAYRICLEGSFRVLRQRG